MPLRLFLIRFLLCSYSNRSTFTSLIFTLSFAMLLLLVLVYYYSVWTIARLGWGFIALTSVMQDWLNSAQKTVQYYSLILVRNLIDWRE